MLREISFEALETTLPILSRGFPGMRRGGWAAAIERLRRFGAPEPARCAGYMLEEKGRDVGVILTIPSSRPGDPPGEDRIVNLSSWYVDPDYRWRAPHMLKAVTASETTLYTDLTATPPVRTMIERFGFRGWTEGTLVFAIPQFAIGPVRGAHVVPLLDLPPDAFAGPMRAMLEQHAALDCIVGGLWDGTELHPVIFSRKNYHGIPVARLIFADDRATIFAHLAAISRFLLREKMLLLAINGNRSERVAGSIFTRRSAPAFYKGARQPGSCDLAFSEYVFLQI
jgi:hypothetical protein